MVEDVRSITPIEITRSGQHDVRVRWQDGHASIYPAQVLRLACPCAACVDEVTGERRIHVADVAHNVRPLSIQPVGRYAITIQWSDGHHTGIYAFELLRNLCPCEACRGAA